MIRKFALTLAVAVLCVAGTAQAANWTNGSGDFLWSTTSNWSTGVVPIADNVVFGTGTGVNVDASYTMGTTGKLTVSAPNDFLFSGTGMVTFRSATNYHMYISPPTTGLTYTFNVPVATTATGAYIFSNENQPTIVFNSKLGTTDHELNLCSRPGTTMIFSSTYGAGLTSAYNTTLEFNGAGGVCAGKYYGFQPTNCTVILDNSVSYRDRWMNYNGAVFSTGNKWLAGGGITTMQILGNSTTVTAVYLKTGSGSTASSSGSGVSDMILVHSGTRVTLDLATANVTTTSGGVWRFSGNNFGETSLLGHTRVVVKSTQPLVNGLLPAMFVGQTNTEFAVKDASNLVQSLTTVGRAALVTNTGVATDNVLASTDTSALTTLDGDLQMNTLKLNGNYGIDLAGHTLTLNANGIIQVGTANSQGIFNGTLTPQYADASPSKTVYLSNDSDFRLSSVSIGGGGGIMKFGQGKLILEGTAMAAGTLKWHEGSLEVKTQNDMSLTGGRHGISAGKLTVDMPTGAKLIMTADSGAITSPSGRWNHQGGTDIINGTLQFGNGAQNKVDYLGVGGDITISANGVLDLQARMDVGNPKIILNSGRIKMMYGTQTNYENAGFSGSQIIEINGTSTIDFGGTGGVRPDRYNALFALTGSGTLVKTGVNPLDQDIYTGLGFNSAASGNSTFDGNIDIQQGIINVFYAGSYPKNVKSTNIASGAMLFFRYSDTLDNTRFTGNGVIVANSQLLTTGTWTEKTLSVDNVAFSPGSLTAAGTFTVNGNLDFISTGINRNSLNIKVMDGNAVAGVSYDTLQMLQTGTIARTGGLMTNLDKADLHVNIPQGLALKGDILTIVTAPGTDFTLSTTFNSVAFDNYAIADVHYNTGSITMDRLATAGDGNRDGYVDVIDFGVMLTGWYLGAQPGTTHDEGDYNHDGAVNVIDFGVMLSNWNTGIPNQGAGDVTATPEPMTLSLLALGGLALLRKRRNG